LGSKFDNTLIGNNYLIELADQYIKDINANSTMLTRIQRKTGKTQTQSFKMSKSKPIIDEIDKVLAKHYGFTEEELDFIINYDIKYRMGGELEREE
jgi:cupin superfamily acireductone dioxygenase involved in methionine salvage